MVLMVKRKQVKQKKNWINWNKHSRFLSQFRQEIAEQFGELENNKHLSNESKFKWCWG
jgi:hypothetical protein